MHCTELSPWFGTLPAKILVFSFAQSFSFCHSLSLLACLRHGKIRLPNEGLSHGKGTKTKAMAMAEEQHLVCMSRPKQDRKTVNGNNQEHHNILENMINTFFKIPYAKSALKTWLYQIVCAHFIVNLEGLAGGANDHNSNQPILPPQIFPCSMFFFLQKFQFCLHSQIRWVWRQRNIPHTSATTTSCV